MTILATGRTTGILVTAQTIPVIGGFQPRLVHMILPTIIGLALQLYSRERVSVMAVAASDDSTLRALGMAAGAAPSAGPVPSGVVVAACTVAGDLDMCRMVEADRVEQARQSIELNLSGATGRCGSNDTCRAQQPDQGYSEGMQ